MEEPKVKIPRFKLQSREWFPLKLGEWIFRVEDGDSFFWPIIDDDFGRVEALAERYAKQLKLGLTVDRLKLIYEDESGDCVSNLLQLTPTGNKLALDYKTEVESGQLKAVQSGREWYPVKLGEALLRLPISEHPAENAVYWPVAPNTTSNGVMSLAKSYANRIDGLKVATKLGKTLIKRDGKDAVLRIVIMFETGNQKAIDWAQKAAAEGTADRLDATITPQAAEAFYSRSKPSAEPPRRRGRPPIIRSPADQARWEEEWKKRDAESKAESPEK